MADAVLSVEIGANIASLQKALSDAVKIVKDTEVSISKSSSSISTSISRNIASFDKKPIDDFVSSLKNTESVSKSVSLASSILTKDVSRNLLSFDKNRIDDFVASFKRVPLVSNDVSQSLAKSAAITAQSGQAISTGSNKAAFALTNLGRVAQDAPFGFIGIQNNLNPLLESFQALQKETGSTGGALKALGSSLIGPAGIGVALSVVSAGFLFYQQYQQKAAKQTEQLAGSTKNLTKSLKELSESQASEVANLSALYNASQDLNLPLATRKRLVKELQSQYPETFKNFKTEAILAGDATKAYDALSRSIINAAIVKASKQNLEEQIKPYSELINSLEIQQAKLDQINEERQKKAKEQGKNSINTTFQAQFFVDENGDTKNIEDYKKELQAKIKTAQKSLNNVIEKFGIGELLKQDSKKAETAYNRIKVQPIDIEAIISQQDKAGQEIKKKTVPIIQKLIDESSGKKPVIVAVPIQVDLINPEVTSDFDLSIQKITEKLGLDYFDEISSNVNAFADGISNDLAPLIAGAFEQLGAAFNTGDFSNIGQGFLDALTGLITNFGKITIQEGLFHLAKGLAYSLSPLTAALAPGEYAVGGGLVAAGGIASAVGGLVGSSSSGSSKGGYQIPGFATGVTNFGGGLALVGERGPELVNLPTRSNVITNQNTQALIRSGGRGNTQTIIPDLRISGQDLVVVFNRAEKVNKRR